MKEHIYHTTGTCSQAIRIVMDENVINEIQFVGGCNGNLQGIAALAKGHTPDEIIARLEGIKCGMKPTSCPDQLAQALKEIQS